MATRDIGTAIGTSQRRGTWAVFGSHDEVVEQFSAAQQREIRALAAEVMEDGASREQRRRGRPATAEASPPPLRCAHPWLPAGQLLATEQDVMRALTVGETKVDELVRAGLLVPVRIDTLVRFHPHEVEGLVERLRAQRHVRTASTGQG